MSTEPVPAAAPAAVLESQSEPQTAPPPPDNLIATSAPPTPTTPSTTAMALAVARLPAGIGQRLAQIVDQGGGVLEVLTGLDEVLPEFLRAPTAPVARPTHPVGDSFFSGEAGNLSDSEAEELARQQLARCGLLRGQQVRHTPSLNS